MKRLALLIAVLVLISGTVTPSAGQGERYTRATELAYGSDPLQKLDFWRGNERNAPLVAFVHGGGWKRGDKQMVNGSAKLANWQAKGFAVASLNYRLVPRATVEQQARDIADAIAYLRGNAARLGLDQRRFVLVGHSAGAHLVALVGTDPQYLRAAGLSPEDVSGIVALDGAAYDVPSQMSENARLMGDTYVQAFGTDSDRQRALSPTHHAVAPNAPAFLIVHVERDDAREQSEKLGSALRRAGTPVMVRQFAGRGLRGHMEINRKLGQVDYPATAVVDAFLLERFAKP